MYICLLRGSKNAKNVWTKNRICSNGNLTSKFYTPSYVLTPNLQIKANCGKINGNINKT